MALRRFRSQNIQSTWAGMRFWELRCSTVVAWNAFRSLNGKSTLWSDHFWTSQAIFGRWDVDKMHALVAWRCVKYIRKQKMQWTVPDNFFGCWDVRKVKNVDNWRPRTTFGRWKLKKRMLLWCEGHLHVQSVKNWRLDRFWTWRCRKSAQRCSAGHIRIQKCQKVTASDHFWTWETDPKNC